MIKKRRAKIFQWAFAMSQSIIMTKKEEKGDYYIQFMISINGVLGNGAVKDMTNLRL